MTGHVPESFTYHATTSPALRRAHLSSALIPEIRLILTHLAHPHPSLATPGRSESTTQPLVRPLPRILVFTET